MIEQVMRIGLTLMGGRPFDQVYLHAGINNLTCKIGFHEVTPVFNNWSLLIQHLMIQLHEARSALYKLSNTVIICDMTGLHIGTYNASNTSFDPQPDILDRGIMRVNGYIADMNQQDEVHAPYPQTQRAQQLAPQVLTNNF